MGLAFFCSVALWMNHGSKGPEPKSVFRSLRSPCVKSPTGKDNFHTEIAKNTKDRTTGRPRI